MERNLGVRSGDGLGSCGANIVSYNDVIYVSNVVSICYDIGIGDVLNNSRLFVRPATVVSGICIRNQLC
jgi:hypothetical protein